MTTGPGISSWWNAIPLILFSFLLSLPIAVRATEEESNESHATYDGVRALRRLDQKKWVTASHRKHEALQADFTRGPEVTAACLSCHNEAGDQLMRTLHWTWLCPADPSQKMGKAGLTLNNF